MTADASIVAARLGTIILAALFALVGRARAEVVTLVCSTPHGYSITLDVDVVNRTVCDLASGVKPPCSLERAQITERYVKFGDNTLDRSTGIIRWASGSTGACRRARGDILR